MNKNLRMELALKVERNDVAFKKEVSRFERGIIWN